VRGWWGLGEVVMEEEAAGPMVFQALIDQWGKGGWGRMGEGGGVSSLFD
jgi:hypothetical protein